MSDTDELIRRCYVVADYAGPRSFRSAPHYVLCAIAYHLVDLLYLLDAERAASARTVPMSPERRTSDDL